MRKKRIEHPFLFVDTMYKTYHIADTHPEVASILYLKAHMSCHHLYPKNRTGKTGPYCHITLKLWCYKHFFGWNSLFQFFYKENGQTIHSELTIDEIITLMIIEHPFIMEKVGTKPWRVLFKEKTVQDAIDILCRMLSMKFHREHVRAIHHKIDVAISKKFAA